MTLCNGREEEERVEKNPYEMDITELNNYIRVLDGDFEPVRSATVSIKRRNSFGRFLLFFLAPAEHLIKKMRNDNYLQGKYCTEECVKHRVEMEALRGKLQWEMLEIPKAKPDVVKQKSHLIQVYK